MKKLLKVTCILTSYNRPIGVAEAIASVQAQTYPNWELIIVDDNSDKMTQSILRDIVRKDKRCKLIQTGVKDEDRFKTARYATCINIAIPLIKGELVTYLTDDDIFYQSRFEKMVEVFRHNPAVHVVYGRQKVVILNNGVEIHKIIRPLVGVTRSPGGKVDHNSIMHRRSCLNLVKRWDDHSDLWTYADAAFFQKLAQHWDFYPLNFITDEHRLHENGVQSLMSRGENPWGKGRDLRFSLDFQLNKLAHQIIETPPGESGWLDFVNVGGTKITAGGWARNPFTGKPGEEVIIVNQMKQILAYAKVTHKRDDVAAHFQNGLMENSGWSVNFEKSLLPIGDNSLTAYVFIRKEKKAIRLCGEFHVAN